MSCFATRKKPHQVCVVAALLPWGSDVSKYLGQAQWLGERERSSSILRTFSPGTGETSSRTCL